MAFWQRRSNNRVFVYTFQDGKQKALRRELLRSLDSEPDHNVEAWVQAWSERNEHKDVDPLTSIPAEYNGWIDEYIADMKARRKSRKTWGDHYRSLKRHIIPYFVGYCGKTNPNEWPVVSAKLATWMRAKEGMTEFHIARANAALNGFWGYLSDTRQVLSGLGIRARPAEIKESGATLPRPVLPDEVLTFVRATNDEDVKLMALLGYFFSLRPQETFALRRCDFITGTAATKLEACQVMSQHHWLQNEKLKLYGRMAVNVHRQRTQEGKFAPPKSYSSGFVSCFNESAARLLVEILLQRKPDDLLFKFLPDRNFKLWRRVGILKTLDDKSRDPKKLILKNLRAASCYHLGHYSSMDRSKLRSHMRHKKEETTQKYMRRPGETPDGLGNLDLDA